MKSRFNRLSAGKKAQMKSVISIWKKVGGTSEVLAEGLAMLADSNRDSAEFMINNIESRSVAVAATFGKGRRAKLALEKDDAQMLLEVVEAIRGIDCTELEHKQMIEVAASILLDGKQPTDFFVNGAYEPLRKVLEQFDPKVSQGSLF